ncbi:MAG TPA: hypothetical protein VFV17_00775 [Usitatibacteraceae bacterium]|nr:hypothetical protein [Usitatibacteraceae bacterium]
MNPKRRLFTTSVALFGISAFAGAANAADKGQGKDKDKEKGNGKGKGKAHHKNGKQLLGEKVKKNGKHVLEKKGPSTASVDVKDGKIAGFKVKHDTKGDVAVTKYKSSKKMAHVEGFQLASLRPAQLEYVGTIYIGYAYIDEDGYEEIYWFPYDMIYDGDTGATEYIPVY